MNGNEVYGDNFISYLFSIAPSPISVCVKLVGGATSRLGSLET